MTQIVEHFLILKHFPNAIIRKLEQRLHVGVGHHIRRREKPKAIDLVLTSS